MTKYRTYCPTDGWGEVFEAADDAAARAYVAQTLRDSWLPGEATSTFWVWAALWREGADGEEEEVRGVTVAVDPEPPWCEAPRDLEELEDLDTEDLVALAGLHTLDVREEEGHSWGQPWDLVGGLETNPGVWAHGGGVWTREVCLRCGVYRIVDSWAQDPDTGAQGLRSTEYQEADEESKRYLAELVSRLREEEEEEEKEEEEEEEDE